MTDSNHDQYTWWRDALEGKVGPLSADDPMPGFYRSKRLNKQTGDVNLFPVAYWYDKGTLRCLVDNAVVDDMRARELWPFVSQHPVSHDAYLHAIKTGEWSDVHRIETPQDAPADADECAALKTQISAGQIDAAQYATIEDDETAKRAQSLRSQLLAFRATAEKAHKKEKEPHLEAGRAVDRRWFPLRDMAEDAAKKIARALGAWEDIKRNAARAAAERAEQEKLLADVAGKPAPEPPKSNVPTPSAQIKGGGGRAAAVKVAKIVTVTDEFAVFAFFKGDADLSALLQKLAQRGVDAGLPVPGITIEEKAQIR